MKKHITISGLVDSYITTQKNIKLLQLCFKKVFLDKEALLLCWGSVARNEMGPYSDIDIIIIEENYNPDKITEFTNYLNKIFKNRIDILDAYTLEDLYNIASTDATSRQALLFARPIYGNKIFIKKFYTVQKNLINEEYNNFRESVHAWITLQSVSNNLVKKNIIDIKASRGFLRFFNYIYLIVKLQNNTVNNIVSTKDAIVEFNKLGLINNNLKRVLLSNLGLLLSFRNIIQSVNKNEGNILDSISINTISENLKLSTREIHEYLKNINKKYITFEKIIFEILSNKSKKFIINCEDTKTFDILLDSNSKLDDLTEKKIINSRSELLNTLLAHRCLNYNTLEKLRKEWIGNWYVLYGIANNQNASALTLYKLVKSDQNFNDNFKRMYNGFAWRNIRLSISKNCKANKKTLLYIINHENSRPMDILAAKTNLLSKK